MSQTELPLFPPPGLADPVGDIPTAPPDVEEPDEGIPMPPPDVEEHVIGDLPLSPPAPEPPPTLTEPPDPLEVYTPGRGRMSPVPLNVTGRKPCHSEGCFGVVEVHHGRGTCSACGLDHTFVGPGYHERVFGQAYMDGKQEPLP